MSVYAYQAYGLRIHAEILCPELTLDPEPDDHPDVVIQLLPPVPSVFESLENGYYEVRPRILRLAISHVARYVVEDGKRVLIEPVAGASQEEIRLFLLGSAMGALLYQRGLFPLHGCAVETRWGAMIFVGSQGAGKSTLAAQFHHRGYRLLSDDVCAVATTATGFEVLPAQAYLRLCTDAYERAGTPEGASFNVDKFVVPMNDGYCSVPKPLRAIHLLGDQDSGAPKFEVLRGFSRIQSLFENLYRPQYLEGQRTQCDLMRVAGQIAQEATIIKVSRKRDPKTIDSLVDFLESAWMKCFGQNSMEERS